MPQVSTDQLVRRAADGEHFSFAAEDRPLDDLLSVAAAACHAGGEVELTGIGGKPIEDLIRIAVTGGDHVIFGSDGTKPSAQAPRRRLFLFG